MSSRRIWSQREDQTFRRIASEYQPKNWAIIAKRLASQCGSKKRTGKQCRERWYNHLDPTIEKKGWTKKDEELLLALHKEHGNKWTVIADKMTGRSDNSIKNYFYSTVRRNLRRMGKLLGSKNSTGLMRQIKPSTMTKIFGSLNEEQDETLCSYLQKEGLSKKYLLQSCDNIRTQIIHFSYYKPKKNDKVSEEERHEYQNVFEMLKKVNEIYERVREEEKHNRTDKQLFRHYYQEMNREQSQEQSQEESFEEELDEDEEDNSIEKKLSGKSTRGRQIKPNRTKYNQIGNKSPINRPRKVQIKVPEPIEVQRPPQIILDSSTLTQNNKMEIGGLASIVEFAQEIEYNDPDFNIEINQEQAEKPIQESGNLGSLQIDMSKMSFKSPACNFGTPVSQVNFFKSPRNIRVTCLTDYLMRLSSSLGAQGLDLAMSNSYREQDKSNSAKKSFQ